MKECFDSKRLMSLTSCFVHVWQPFISLALSLFLISPENFADYLISLP